MAKTGTTVTATSAPRIHLRTQDGSTPLIHAIRFILRQCSKWRATEKDGRPPNLRMEVALGNPPHARPLPTGPLLAPVGRPKPERRAMPYRRPSGASPPPRGGFETSTLRRAIVALVALKIAGIILVFDPTGLDVFNFPKSLFSRAIAWILAGLLALVVVRFGRAIIPATRLHLLALAFVAVNVLSALSAENAYVAAFGEHEQYLGLTFVFDMLILYSAVAIAFRRAVDWAVLALAIASAAALSAGYAAVQSVGLDPVHWDIATSRPFGTFGNPDMLGLFLSLLFGGALGIALFATARGAVVVRIAAVAIGLLALVAAAATATRGSVVGFVSALAMAQVIYLKLRGPSGVTAGRVVGRPVNA